MKKTLLVVALAVACSTAMACEQGCPGDSSVSVGGIISGGASDVVSASSNVVGTGTSSSDATSSSVSEAGLSITTNSSANDRNGTASVGTTVLSGTYNAGTASASSVNTGSGSGSASAGALAGSSVVFAVRGSVSAGSDNASFSYGGSESSGVLVGASSAHGGGSVSADAGTLLNAVGGVAVQNCDNINAVSGYFGDAKGASTDVNSHGNAFGFTNASAGASGTFHGVIPTLLP